MPVQIQIYNPDDLTAERKVVSQLIGQETQDTIDAWFFNQTEGVVLTKGTALTLVPNDHPWYITPAGEIAIGVNNVATNPDAPTPNPTSGKQVTAEQAIQANKKAADKRRLDSLEKKRKYAQFMADNK